MTSDNSTSAGLYLTYLAVSVGYDINLSKILGGVDRSRKRFRFGFNCMLFAAEFYMSKMMEAPLSSDSANMTMFIFHSTESTIRPGDLTPIIFHT